MDSHKELAPPDLEAKKIPKKVKSFVHSALSKNPSERPPTAQAFASKLRANAEGLGELFRRSLVIYSKHLPKFLLAALLTSIPFLLLTVLKVLFKFLELAEVVDDGTLSFIIGATLSVTLFFVQIFCAAFLVGITTWIVAQILAFPLRPISLRAAFKEAGKHWKQFAGTVTVSTILSLIGLALCFFPGVWLSARFMLITPSIMMENLSGKAAFRRSTELTKRSFRTVFATALLVYVVPGTLALIIAFAIGGIVKGVSSEIKENRETSEIKNDDLSISVGGGNITVTNNDEKNPSNEDAKKTRKMIKNINPAIASQIFELIWLPVIVLISSFTSVLTALLYFKTRQTGGESMNDLLEQFEETDRPKSNWQKRIRERIQQSGKLTSKL